MFSRYSSSPHGKDVNGASASTLDAAGKASIENRFSLQEFKKVHAELIENKEVTANNEHLVVEILRVLSEMVVYGDSKSELLFDYFCEKNILALFLEIMWWEGGCATAVLVQILQTLSILISCVKNDTSLYYLLSNNRINDVIIFPYDLSADESLCAQFASFIKTLSLRLNEQTVQFFFIEETGAFPLLSKAIDLLKQSDPMVRISAQATILNVYKVDEAKAREYSLQEEVMLSLFTIIVQLMNEQLKTLTDICWQYYRAATEVDEATMKKMEQNVEDVFASVEDWFYYVQDLFDLRIDVFSKALTASLVENFVSGVIMRSLHYLIPVTGEDSSDKSNNQDKNDVEATVSLFYLLQMLLVIGDKPFLTCVAINLWHPLNEQSRSSLLSHCIATEANKQQSFDGMESLPIEDHQESDFALTMNRNRQLFNQLFASENQRLVLLAAYVMHYLITSITEWGALSVVGNKDQKGCSILSTLEILPRNIFPTNALSMGFNVRSLPQSFNPLIISDEELEVLHRYLMEHHHPVIDTHPDLTSSCLLRVLKAPSNYSLTTYQVCIFTTAVLIRSLKQGMDGGNHLVKESVMASRSEDSFDNHLPMPLVHALQEACHVSATALLRRLDGSTSDMLLTIFNEEMKRSVGRSWRGSVSRMYKNKLLMLPNTANNLHRMSIDYDFPISQTELMRKEVQHFMMMKALYQVLFQRQFTIEDLAQISCERDWICVDEDSMVDEALKEGNVFDMKGRKFLDAVMTQDGVGMSTAVTTTSAHNSPSSWWLPSQSLMGLSGITSSSAKKNSSLKMMRSPVREGSSSSSSSTGKVREETMSPSMATTPSKLLFVQDPQLLLLTCSDKSSGRPIYRVFVSAPLLYTDAKLDLKHRKRFKLVVRSWKKVMKNMQQVLAGHQESPEHDRLDVTMHDKYGSVHSAECFLRAPEPSSFWEITLTMDTEQACALAVQHVEKSRKLITDQKMEQLKRTLLTWTNLDEAMKLHY